jgi:hypothetical protein
MPVLLRVLFLALGLALGAGRAVASDGQAPVPADAVGQSPAGPTSAEPQPRSRPVVVLWLAHERDGERVLFNAETDPALQDAVREHSAARETRFTFPLADLEDQQRLPAEAVWVGDAEAIADASDRYGAEGILAGAVAQPAVGRWRADWTLLPPNAASEHFRTEAAGMAEVVIRGLDAATARLAAGRPPASRETPAEAVRVRVGNVATLGDFGRALGAFRSLEGVEDVVLQQTRDDVVVLEVRIPGGVDALDRRARGVEALEPLAPSPGGTEGSTEGAALSYRLRP